MTGKTTLRVAVTAAAATAIASATASHIITRRLIDVALKRDYPKSFGRMRSRLSNTVRSDGFQESINESAARLLTRQIDEVVITSRDGLRLVGHWYHCENAKRVLVAMHGWRSSWNKDFGMIADFWHNEGCSILFAEQRGQNNSEGEFMTFGHMERYDCLDWVTWVNEKTENAYPVYLAGVSLGASTVLMAAGLDLPENVSGIIADCGFSGAYGIWRHVVKDNMRLGYGLRGRVIDAYCKKHLKVSSRDISTLSAMERTKTPILFIHGSDDSFVPIRMTYENYKACAAPKELLVVPVAIHGQSYYLEPEKYEAKTRAFWLKYDTPISNNKPHPQIAEYDN